MIELIIDGTRCDLGDMPILPIGFNLDELSNIESGGIGRTIELSIPFTPNNDALLGNSCDIYAKERFNEHCHTATIAYDGIKIVEGKVHLLATDIRSGYTLRIEEEGYDWVAKVSENRLSQLPIEFSGDLTLPTIEESWGDNCAVRFLPVYRGNYDISISKDSIHPVEQVLLTDDFHPFISVAEMVRQIFAECGYTLKSSLFNGGLAENLYMSGDYVRSDVEADRIKCDFLARRQNRITVFADFSGRVYASKAFISNTVGNIVDTVDPNAVDSDGNTMSDTFATEDCFRLNEDEQICFVPPTAVNVGFILNVKYVTDYKIATRERLKGFDKFEGLNGVKVEYVLANSFKDCRDSALPNFSYLALVFDHESGREYRLIEHTSLGTQYTMGEWSARSATVETDTEGDVVGLTLYYRDSASDEWAEYEGDWAIYADNIKESGRVGVEMTVRMPPQEVAAGEELLLDKFWFGGAEKGMFFTLCAGTSLRPYFTNQPGYGSQIEYADIAPKRIRQIELLNALAQMFNLVFLTDKEQRSVRVEPLEWLYDRDNIIDWTSRIDFAQPVVLSDTGLGRPNRIELSYLDADKATHAFNLENETLLGHWGWSNTLCGAREATRSLENPLFTTTLNRDNVLGFAPSASLLQVGDVGDSDSMAYGAFTPRIVYYLGNKPLPDGEYWNGSNSDSNRVYSYPCAAFVDGELGVNLCFEERNGVVGLSRFYEPQLLRERYRQTLSLTLHLSPTEITQLTRDNGLAPSVRNIYRFSILGEKALFRLAEIEKWDASQSTIRCKFYREMYD